MHYSWCNDIVWVCPPPNLGLECLVHMYECKSIGIICLPDWKSLPVRPFLENEFFGKFLVNVFSFPGKLFLESSNVGVFSKAFKGALNLYYYNFK